MMLAKGAFAAHVIDVVGGSGIIESKVESEESLTGVATAKAETSGDKKTARNVFLGVRYTYVANTSGPTLMLGGELSVLLNRLTSNGNWQFTHLDSNKNITGTVAQSFDNNNTPTFTTYRFLGHLSVGYPFNSVLGIEAGVMAGITSGSADYSYTYTINSTTKSQSSGPSGLGLHGALRMALRLFPQSAVTVGFEYRYFGEFSGEFLAFIPGFFSTYSIANNSGHLFLLSAGYRFGMDLQP